MQHIIFYQNGQLQAIHHDQLTRHFFREGNLLFAESHRALHSKTTILYTTDSMRSVIGSAEGVTHATNYTPYGFCLPDEPVFSTLAFTGEKLEKQFGIYLLGNGHRSYSPTVFRFYAPDSLSPFLQGGLNSYAYCSNDPINYRDPTGHQRTPLGQINTGQPPRHSGNPALNRSRRLIERARAHERRAEEAGTAAQYAERLSVFHERRADHLTASAAGSTTPHRRSQLRQSAERHNKIADYWITAAVKHKTIERNQMQKAVATSRKLARLQRRDEENLPPSPITSNLAPPNIQNTRMRTPSLPL